MKITILIPAFVALLAVIGQRPSGETIHTAADLFAACESSGEGRRLCLAYIRGFADGHRWLLRDAPVTAVLAANSHTVCIPNSESVETAASLFVARFKERSKELDVLSPYRALSQALAGRYKCG